MSTTAAENTKCTKREATATPQVIRGGDTETSQHQETSIPPDARAGAARTRADRGRPGRRRARPASPRRCEGQSGGTCGSRPSRAGAWGPQGQRRRAGGREPGHGGAGTSTDARPCGQETSGGGHGTHSRALAWRIPRTAGAGGLQSMGSQRVRHDQATHTHRRPRERKVF